MDADARPFQFPLSFWGTWIAGVWVCAHKFQQRLTCAVEFSSVPIVLLAMWTSVRVCACIAPCGVCCVQQLHSRGAVAALFKAWTIIHAEL